VVAEGKSAKKTIPLSASAVAEDEQQLSLTGGTLSMVPKRWKLKATSVLAVECSPTR
jgi:hypothetical protein